MFQVLSRLCLKGIALSVLDPEIVSQWNKEKEGERGCCGKGKELVLY